MTTSRETQLAHSSARKRTLVAATGVLAVLLILACWFGLSSVAVSLIPMPPLDLSGMDARVQELFQNQKARLLAEPNDADAWGELGMTLMAYERDAEAIPCLRNAIILSPEEFRWHYSLGLAISSVDRSEAIASFREALRLRPEDSLANARIGELLLADGRTDEASQFLERSLQSRSDSAARVLQALARVRLLQGDAKDALRLAQEANQLIPEARMILEVIAQAQHRLGNSEEASSLVRKLNGLRSEPLPWNDPYAASVLAHRLSASHVSEQMMQAIAEGRPALAIQLGEATGRNADEQTAIRLSEAYVAVDRTVDALAVLNQLQQSNPDKAELPFRLGVVHFLRSEWQLAVNAFQRTISLAPYHELAWYNLGQSQIRLGQTTEAITSFQKSLTINPANVNARLALANTYLESGDRKNAEAMLELLELRDQSNPAVEQLRTKLLTP